MTSTTSTVPVVEITPEERKAIDSAAVAYVSGGLPIYSTDAGEIVSHVDKYLGAIELLRQLAHGRDEIEATGPVFDGLMAVHAYAEAGAEDSFAEAEHARIDRAVMVAIVHLSRRVALILNAANAGEVA